LYSSIILIKKNSSIEIIIIYHPNIYSIAFEITFVLFLGSLFPGIFIKSVVAELLSKFLFITLNGLILVRKDCVRSNLDPFEKLFAILADVADVGDNSVFIPPIDISII